MRRTVLFLGLLVLVRPVGADDGPELTIEQAIAQALSRNPRISAAHSSADAARQGVSAARALASPEITLAPGLTRYGSDEELLIAQPLEISGTRAARTAAARAEARAAAARLDTERLVLTAETRKAYHSLAARREALAVAQAILQIARDLDHRVARLIEEGSRPGIDRTHASIEVARARADLAIASAEADAARGTLNILMGRSPSEPIGALSKLEDLVRAPSDAHDANAGSRTRPEVAEAVAQRDAARQGARLAVAETRPDLTVQFRATRLQGGVSETGFGLGIALPFLDWGGRSGRVREASAAARAREAELLAAQARVEMEIFEAQARVHAAEETVGQYRETLLGQADRLLNGARTGLVEGKADILTVLEAQRTYRSVQTEYIAALAALADARAELSRARGLMSPADDHDQAPSPAKGTTR